MRPVRRHVGVTLLVAVAVFGIGTVVLGVTRNIVAHLANANPEYRHPFLEKNEVAKDVGVILVTSDKGLCGGMNTNVLRLLTAKVKEWQQEGRKVHFTAFGNKGFSFLQRFNARIVSHLVQAAGRPPGGGIVGGGDRHEEISCHEAREGRTTIRPHCR